ncbi:MAG TPA: VOC family protein [Streptosporangiaceae bacterium]|nr:VOC family protein [Streptosporangiaceae bacterium]
MYLDKVTVVVSEYDPAIRFFVDVLGFELVEDSPSLTNDGRPKRWVVVRPPGSVTSLLLARADGVEQAAVVGQQTAGRVGFFLHVDDFDAAYTRMTSAGVEFVRAPRAEPYGQVAVFLDIAGNKWDLIGPVRLPSGYDGGASQHNAESLCQRAQVRHMARGTRGPDPLAGGPAGPARLRYLPGDLG